MATICITDLGAAGSELFSDRESFLGELSDELTAGTIGGTAPIATAAWLALGGAASAAAVASAVFSYNVSKDVANRKP